MAFAISNSCLFQQAFPYIIAVSIRIVRILRTQSAHDIKRIALYEEAEISTCGEIGRKCAYVTCLYQFPVYTGVFRNPQVAQYTVCIFAAGQEYFIVINGYTMSKTAGKCSRGRNLCPAGAVGRLPDIIQVNTAAGL